jgi:FtsZ-interacting cell division protein ZipA
MDNLRLILIVLGIVIVLAIYLWERYQSKHDPEKYRTSLPEFDDDSKIIINTKTTFDDDVSSELADLKNFMRESNQIFTDDDMDAILSDKLFDKMDDEAEAGINGIDDEQTNEFDTPEHGVTVQSSENDNKQQKETIVILHIVSTGNNLILGRELVAVVDQLGFTFGDMNIFHYYDKDDSTTRRSLFSLVNMYEPGYFDYKNMADFKTRGISVFASLANDRSGDNIFESMLAVTKHLAELLGCVVLGPDRSPLTEETIKQIQTQLVRSAS